eukprot:768454-Hanusia_phi.AAC.3
MEIQGLPPRMMIEQVLSCSVVCPVDLTRSRRRGRRCSSTPTALHESLRTRGQSLVALSGTLDSWVGGRSEDQGARTWPVLSGVRIQRL